MHLLQILHLSSARPATPAGVRRIIEDACGVPSPHPLTVCRESLLLQPEYLDLLKPERFAARNCKNGGPGGGPRLLFHRVAWPAARWNNEVGNAKHIEFCAANLRENLLPEVQKRLNIL